MPLKKVTHDSTLSCSCWFQVIDSRMCVVATAATLLFCCHYCCCCHSLCDGVGALLHQGDPRVVVGGGGMSRRQPNPQGATICCCCYIRAVVAAATDTVLHPYWRQLWPRGTFTMYTRPHTFMTHHCNITKASSIYINSPQGHCS